MNVHIHAQMQLIKLDKNNLQFHRTNVYRLQSHDQCQQNILTKDSISHAVEHILL